MGNEKTLSRKDFFKNLVAAKSSSSTNSVTENEDPLFKKYSRKTLGERQYSQQTAVPNTDGTFNLRVGNVTSGLAPYTGTWTAWEVMHLLRRINFGIKKSDVDALSALSVSAAVDAILTAPAPTVPSATPLNFYQNIEPDSSGVALGASWVTTKLQYLNGSNDFSLEYRRDSSHEAWNWALCINENGAANIREKMVQFWYHFIPINAEQIKNTEGNGAILNHEYMKLLRTNALGNFKTLIKEITKQPAMLVYLGGQYSTASTPNENFARELLELFTMGKVPTQNYTEADVQAASKIFSGWVSGDFYNGAVPYPFVVSFDPLRHNQSNKIFSSFFGNTTINNQTGANGANEFNIFFDMLFAQQGLTIAKYICRRLYRFFVYYDIDANVEANVIVPLANFLMTSNWEIQPVMSRLLKSQHFFDPVNKGVMIKSPIDYLTGILRTLKINTTVAAPANQLQKQYEVWGFFQYFSYAQLEQGFAAVPNVSGWKAYYQIPSYYQNWINSNTIQQRAEIITYLINGYITPSNGNITLKFDPIAFVQQFPNATIQDPDLLINIIVQYLFSVDLPAAFKAETKNQNLLSGQTNNSYWTIAWANYLSAPTNMGYKNIVTERLNALITSFLQLAEFQLM